MTDAQESMVKAKLAEIADAIPECRGAVFAISTGNDGEEGDVTVFKSAGGKELVNLFDNIAANVAIAIAMETTPEKAVGLIRRYGDAAPSEPPSCCPTRRSAATHRRGASSSRPGA